MEKKDKSEKTHPPEGIQIKTTLTDLQKALVEWNEIPEGADSELEQLKKKTRDLIFRLNEQIKFFDL